MTSKDVGLIGKYIVERVDGKPVEWCFVLEGKDPLAWAALLVYADMAEGAGYLQLATELRAKVKEIGIGPGPMERTWDDGAQPVEWQEIHPGRRVCFTCDRDESSGHAPGCRRARELAP